MNSTENSLNFAPSSLLCVQTIPSTVLATSREMGWTSVLLRHHRTDPYDDPFETNGTPDQTIVVTTRGKQEVQSFNGGVWRTAIHHTGTIGMTPGGKIDRLRRPVRRNPEPFETANLYIPQFFFREAAEQYRHAGRRTREEPLSALAFNDPTIAQAVLSLLRAMRAGAPNLYAESVAQWLSIHLLAAHSPWLEMSGNRRDPGIITDRRLARVIEFMTAHFAEALTLDRLSTEAGISKYHFVRLFRARTGLTPHAYLIQIRMDAGREMLLTTEMTVAEIAAMCGYTRPAHFVTAFAARFGLPPTELRRRFSVD